MHNTIDLSKTVYQIIHGHPEIKDLLIELGFTPLSNPLMAQTLTKTITLPTACKLTSIPLEKVIQTLTWNGYSIKGDENDTKN